MAIIEDEIKQTRCTTCDAEHPYKGGKAPRRRKPDALTAPESSRMTPRDEHEHHTSTDEHEHDGSAERAPAVAEAAPAEADADQAPAPPVDEGPVHRPLIRATLPRPEGFQKDARPAPEFTIRQNGGRAGNFRGGDSRGRGRGASQAGGANGNRPGGGAARFGRGPQGGRQGRPGPAFGRGPQPRHGGGKKRSR
ncbi:MAG TPA: hypothetical protein VFX12_06185 [Vicinamibacterales bacterium]|nr:hypothetical protein [Vicinamibacterales bacterium]